MKVKRGGKEKIKEVKERQRLILGLEEEKGEKNRDKLKKGYRSKNRKAKQIENQERKKKKKQNQKDENENRKLKKKKWRTNWEKESKNLIKSVIQVRKAKWKYEEEKMIKL